MSSHRYVLQVFVICSVISMLGCVSQNGEDYVRTGTPIELEATALGGTDEFLYAMYARITCLDWEGGHMIILQELTRLQYLLLVLMSFSQIMTTLSIVCDGELIWSQDVGHVETHTLWPALSMEICCGLILSENICYQ